MSKIRVLILGTGGMAHTHAQAYADMEGVEVVAGVDTDQHRLSEFNAKFGISRGFSTVEEALDWGNFDAVSNVTPDPVHYPTTLPLLKAGKHVLCEKPLAETYAQAAEMAQVANAAGVINMVNLTYRNVPALIEAARLVSEGAIGKVRHFEASYLQSWLTQPAWGDWKTEDQWLWRLSKEHGSMGVLGDVGIHIIDFATLVAGADVDRISARLTTFDKAPGGRIGEYVLDANDSATMHVKLSNGTVGVIHATRMASGHINDLRLRIFGTSGGLDVRFENGGSMLRGSIGEDMLAGTWRDIPTPTVETNFERFVAAIGAGAAALPDFDRGAVLQSALDAAVTSDATNCGDTTV